MTRTTVAMATYGTHATVVAVVAVVGKPFVAKQGFAMLLFAEK